MQNNFYNPNNVNADNFNATMQGYLDYALDFAKESDVEFTDEQINMIKSGFNWGKNEMTMENARNYKKHKALKWL